MHIFFSGIGGAAIGPLALIAHQAGYDVSGSDKQASLYTDYLQKHGINLHIGQTREKIEAVHKRLPIDWIVYTSALTMEQADPAELEFAHEQGIHTSRRDECLNRIIRDHHFKLIAVAGTHGKTTTTAMIIWALKELGIATSFSVGAKMSFADMGHFDPQSQYFVYECDEFDRNFLAFSPFLSIITAVDWDHHDIFPTRDEYKQAFHEFLAQSRYAVLHRSDATYLNLKASPETIILKADDQLMRKITLAGSHNRRNAAVAVRGLEHYLGLNEDALVHAINRFPGTSRRIEQIAPGIYSDYAHTPEEIQATLQLAGELSDNILAIYEPLTNRRQHYMKDLYTHSFNGAKKVIWLPSYLAREDSEMHVYTPEELIQYLPSTVIAEPGKQDHRLELAIRSHIANGGIAVCMAGGGGGSLDEWLRNTFAA